MMPDFFFYQIAKTIFRKLRIGKRMRRRIFIFLIAGLLLYKGSQTGFIQKGMGVCLEGYGIVGQSAAGGLETAKMERVVDGDTVVVKIGNQLHKVRLIGVDCPESVHPDGDKNTKVGKTASDFTKESLKRGDVVYLQKDVSNVDRYGRLLRYLWVEEPEDTGDIREIKDKMYNAILLDKGYAEAKEFKPDIKYSKIFRQLEKE